MTSSVDTRLMPHQTTAVDWLLAHPRSGLADEMRVGKTAPALVAAQQAGTAQLLVLCPAVAVGMWHRAVQQWAPKLLGRVSVLSYDTYARNKSLREGVLAILPDTVILDEFHYLKTPSSLRTKRVLGTTSTTSELMQGAERVWCLSGTPMPNHAGELWTVFRHVFGEEKSYYSWVQHYTNFTYPQWGGMKILGNRKDTLPELRAKFRQFFLRRTFAEVFGDETSPFHWNAVSVDAGELPKALREMEASPEVRAIVDRIVEGKEDTAADDIHLATLRRLTAEAKLPAVLNYVKDELDSNPTRKLLVLGHHTDLLRGLADRLEAYGAGLITGATPGSARDKVIEAFQSNKTKRVVVGQIQACGTGVDMSAADAVIFAETLWNPGDNVQAANRARHMNKEAPIPVDVLGLSGSVDDAVARTRMRKLKMVSEVLDEERGVG